MNYDSYRNLQHIFHLFSKFKSNKSVLFSVLQQTALFHYLLQHMHLKCYAGILYKQQHMFSNFFSLTTFVNGIVFQAPLASHTCSYNQKRFHLACFQSCLVKARMDDSPTDGGNATLMIPTTKKLNRRLSRPDGPKRVSCFGRRGAAFDWCQCS